MFVRLVVEHRDQAANVFSYKTPFGVRQLYTEYAQQVRNFQDARDFVDRYGEENQAWVFTDGTTILQFL